MGRPATSPRYCAPEMWSVTCTGSDFSRFEGSLHHTGPEYQRCAYCGTTQSVKGVKVLECVKCAAPLPCSDLVLR